MNDESKTVAAAYVPWKTFLGALDQLKSGVPHQLDRTVFPGMAWSVQGQLFVAFKFFGLMLENNTPTAQLRELANASDADRKTILKRLLEEKYADVFALGLGHATMNQLLAKLGEAYGVSGDTREKAVRFFLAAAKYAGVTLSTFIVNAKGAGRPRTRKPNGGARQALPADGGDEGEEEEEPPTPGTSKTVLLKSGGTLTLSATLDMFSLGAKDREFVFGLIDKLKEYESSQGTEETG